MERCGAVSTARAAPWLFCREEEGEQVDDNVDVDHDRGEGALEQNFESKQSFNIRFQTAEFFLSGESQAFIISVMRGGSLARGAQIS